LGGNTIIRSSLARLNKARLVVSRFAFQALALSWRIWGED
jgi:hypothetical protein